MIRSQPVPRARRLRVSGVLLMSVFALVAGLLGFAIGAFTFGVLSSSVACVLLVLHQQARRLVVLQHSTDELKLEVKALRVVLSQPAGTQASHQKGGLHDHAKTAVALVAADVPIVHASKPG